VDRLVLKPAEAAALCGVHRLEIARWIKDGALKTIPHTKNHRIRRVDLDECLALKSYPVIRQAKRAVA